MKASGDRNLTEQIASIFIVDLSSYTHRKRVEEEHYSGDVGSRIVFALLVWVLYFPRRFVYD